MKKILFVTMLLPIIVLGQKKHNVFAEGGIFNFTISSSDKSYGHSDSYQKGYGSLIYSYAPKRKMAFGLGLELSQFPKNIIYGTEHDDPTIAAVADFRYFINSGKNSFFPLVQVGYNILNDNNTLSTVDLKVTNDFSSLGQFALGFGYSRAVIRSRGGPFVQIKFEDQLYRYALKVSDRTSNNTFDDQSLDLNMSMAGVVATVGFRF